MSIAFCFLTINDVLNHRIWTKYFKNIDKSKYNIYVHPKFEHNVKSQFFKSHIISNLKQTSWGHLLNAYFSLLNTARSNPANLKFIMLSDSCIPIQSFDKLYMELITSDQTEIKSLSYINLTSLNLGNFYMSNVKIPKPIIKHSGWFVLSRCHLDKLNNSKFIHNYNCILAGDEYVISLIYPDDNIINKLITFVKWHSQSDIEKIKKQLIELYKIVDNPNADIQTLEQTHNLIAKLRNIKLNMHKHPMTFNNKNFSEYLPDMINSKAFFCRKVVKLKKKNRHIVYNLINN